MDLILSRDNILLAYGEHQSKRRKLHSRNRQQNISDIGRLPPAETVIGKGEVYCHRKRTHGYRPKPVRRRKRHPETKRKNQAAGYPLYLGQAGTAMHQTGHGTNL